MKSHVDPDATEGCQTGSPQVASNSVYGIISGPSNEYQRLNWRHWQHRQLKEQRGGQTAGATGAKQVAWGSQATGVASAARAARETLAAQAAEVGLEEWVGPKTLIILYRSFIFRYSVLTVHKHTYNIWYLPWFKR